MSWEALGSLIRLFTPQQAFRDWWAVAGATEYHGAFAEHIDQILLEQEQ